jgi:hypothetical protein
MSYPDAAWERAMTVQQVMLKALSGEIHWYRAADILGFSPRTLRRWRERYEQHGYLGLVDKRRQSPSVRGSAAPEVKRLLRLYWERYGYPCFFRTRFTSTRSFARTLSRTVQSMVTLRRTACTNSAR